MNKGLIERLREGAKAWNPGCDVQLLYTEAAAELSRLQSERDEEKAAREEAERTIERLTDDAMHKILDMSEDQLNALCRLEGRDPKDAERLSKQAVKLALLMNDLQKSESLVASLRAQLEGREKALRELVRLKDLKDQFDAISDQRATPNDIRALREYQAAKPLAWQAARALLVDKQQERVDD